jgi:MFS family permease
MRMARTPHAATAVDLQDRQPHTAGTARIPHNNPVFMPPVVPALAATLSIQILASMSVLVAPVLAPLAATDLGIEPYLVGVYISIVYGFGAVAALVSGAFIARYGALRVSQICLALCGLSLAIAASGPALALIPAAMCLGLGYGPPTPASSHILARVAPAKRLNLIFSLKQTGVPLGNALAGAALPSLALAVGWRAAALAAGACCVLLALAVQPLRADLDIARETPRPFSVRAHVIEPLRFVFRVPELRRLSIVSLAFSGMQVSLGTFLVTYLVEAIDLAVVTAGAVLSAAQAAGVGGRILWGVVADRYGAPLLVLGALGLAMSVCALVTGVFTPDWPLLAIFAVCFAFGGTAVAWNGVFLAQVALLSPPGRAGEVTGGTSFLTYGGVMITPALFSAILAATGSYEMGFAAVAMMTLAGGVSFLRAALRSA